jgi:hypothetical protein
MRRQWMPADAVPDINRIARQQQFIRTLASMAVKRSLSDPLTANTIADHVLDNLTVDKSLSKADVLSFVDVFRSINPKDTRHVSFATMPWTTGPDQDGQSVLYVRQPDADTLLTHLGGTTNATAVAVNGVSPTHTSSTQPPPASSAAASPYGSPSGSSSGPPPPAVTRTETPGEAATPQIENQTQFGPPAPRMPPC